MERKTRQKSRKLVERKREEQQVNRGKRKSRMLVKKREEQEVGGD